MAKLGSEPAFPRPASWTPSGGYDSGGYGESSRQVVAREVFAATLPHYLENRFRSRSATKDAAKEAWIAADAFLAAEGGE